MLNIIKDANRKKRIEFPPEIVSVFISTPPSPALVYNDDSNNTSSSNNDNDITTTGNNWSNSDCNYSTRYK